MGSENPTNVRWRVVILLMGFGFMNHFNRISMTVAGDERIMAQYGISPEQMGRVYSAFLVVYAILMIPGGCFIDRFGPHSALVVMGFGTAVFCGLTGMIGFLSLTAGGILAAFMVIRALMGVLTTPLYPGGARMVSHWVPHSHRARANGFVTCAAPLGVASCYVVFAYLIQHLDWPLAFLLSAAVTAMIAWVWKKAVTDHPAQHPSVNEAERRLTDRGDAIPPAGKSAGVSTVAGGFSWSNRSLLLLALSFAAVGYVQYMFGYWMHFYFDSVLHLGKEDSRFYAGIPQLAWAAGMPLGGWLSDRLRRSLGQRLGFALVAAGGMIASAALLGLGVLATNPLWIVVWFSLALGAVGISETPFWVTAVELGGARGGTAAALVNTGGNAGGALAPALTPWVSAHWGWPWGIGLGGLICLLGAFCWAGIVSGNRNGKTDNDPR